MKTLLAVLLVAALLVFASKLYADEVTYVDGVSSIINNNCVVCHRQGGIGPMSFESYEQVRPWAPLIQHKIATREMPPYAYDQGIGIQDLQGDWRLPQNDIDTVVNWVRAGAPQGDPDIEAARPELPDLDEWSFAAELGPPTLVIPSIPIDIPASGNDLWHKHLVNSGVTEDRCIKAVQVKPLGRAKAVVHHANSNIVMDGIPGAMLTEYAMGKWGELVPAGVCRTFPANAQIRWDIHMFPGGVGAMAQGEMVKDNVVEIGLWFHEPDFEAKYKQDLSLYRLGAQADIVIPPNGYYMTQGFKSFDHPVRIDSWQPHGHLRMNAASLEIFNPTTGQTDEISQVSNWSAVWHHSHIFAPGAAPLVPTGSVLIMKQWYDNTSNNPNNPDPDQWVVGGSRTGDEMTHNWMAITHLDDEGYNELIDKRDINEN